MKNWLRITTRRTLGQRDAEWARLLFEAKIEAAYQKTLAELRAAYGTALANGQIAYENSFHMLDRKLEVALQPLVNLAVEQESRVKRAAVAVASFGGDLDLQRELSTSQRQYLAVATVIENTRATALERAIAGLNGALGDYRARLADLLGEKLGELSQARSDALEGISADSFKPVDFGKDVRLGNTLLNLRLYANSVSDAASAFKTYADFRSGLAGNVLSAVLDAVKEQVGDAAKEDSEMGEETETSSDSPEMPAPGEDSAPKKQKLLAFFTGVLGKAVPDFEKGANALKDLLTKNTEETLEKELKPVVAEAKDEAISMVGAAGSDATTGTGSAGGGGGVR